MSQNQSDAPPLLTPSRPNRYQKVIALGIGLEITTEIQNNTDKNPCETDDKNRIKNQLKISQIFHRTSYARVQRTTTKNDLE
jgi:hypothetical protein